MSKQPWELTEQEYIASEFRVWYEYEHGTMEGFEVWLTSPLARQDRAILSCNISDGHHDLIEEAIAKGYTLPESVRSEYAFLF